MATATNSTIMNSAAAAGGAGDPSGGNSAGTPSGAFLAMQSRWHVINALLGGTPTMRAAGEQYLPKEPAETAEAYQSRLSRTTLFNGLKKAVQNLTGRIFSKPITVGEDMPEQLEYLEEDCDRMGNHLNVFARKVFEDGAAFGLTHILVDMPPPLPEGATLADERESNHRPYFVQVPANKLIGWRYAMQGGRMVLVQARVLECVEEQVGQFGSKVVDQVKVLEPGKWTTYRQNDKKEWVPHETGTTTLNKVPLVTYYTGFKSLMHAEPPLEDLAHLNVQHWQSSSDQRHILHVARVPLLFGAGLSTVGTEGEVTIGPDNLIKGPMGSTLEYVEHSGAALTAGQQDVDRLEDKMAIMGLEPVMPRSGATNPTATGRVIDSVENASLLQMWSVGLGDALEQCYALAAEWLGLDTEDTGELQPNTDLAFSLRDAQDLQTLLQARLNGEITRETFWKELRRRNVLSDTFDAETEKEVLADEGAEELEKAVEQMKAMGSPPKPGAPGDEKKDGPPPKAPGTNLGGGA